VSLSSTKVATVSAFALYLTILQRRSIFADAMPMNCEGMYRGVIGEDGDAKVAIFHDDVLA
jgi:hypothetical protein